MEFENSAVKVGHRWTIKYDGIQYNSISDFCLELDLVPPTVHKQLNTGMTIDEVVLRGRKRASKRRAVDTARQSPCGVDGVTYPSISAAAKAMNIPASWIYQFKKKHGYTVEETIENVREAYDDSIIPSPVRDKGHVRKCVVNGVAYPSQSEAARAYGVTLSTVTSRMAHDDSSFADALLSVIKRRKGQMPVQMLDKNLRGTPLPKDDLPNNLALQIVIESLEKYHYKYEILIRPDQGIVVKLFEKTKISEIPLECCLILPRPEKAVIFPVEFLIPRLFEPKGGHSTAILNLLINQINNENLGVKVFVDIFTGVVSASGFHLINRNGQFQTLVPALLFFLSSAEDAFVKLSKQQ